MRACAVDNPELLQQLADSDEYHNLILDTNERIFEEQIELFSFFFGTDTLTDSQRWDFVEEYFTGTTVEELKKKYGGSPARMSLVHVPSLQLLKGQPFVSILQVYDAAILEAVLFEDMLQDMVVAVRVCP